jgi:hypothetical protein
VADGALVCACVCVCVCVFRYNLGALWSWTRHPNFAGEGLCWIGVAIVASNLGRVWSVYAPLIAAASPAMTSILMLFEAGLLAEWKNNHRYGTLQHSHALHSTAPSLTDRLSDMHAWAVLYRRCLCRRNKGVPGLPRAHQRLCSLPASALRTAPDLPACDTLLRLAAVPPLVIQ